ncbi:MAG: AMP-binding protein, partial [bacterium]|nr:AMP-binding protein [bacterium]
VDMHHIISDGASLEILGGEFLSLVAGETLSPLQLCYRDYAAWQSSSEQKQLIKKQEKYWEKTFSGELPVLDLPTDYPRPAIQSFEGNALQFTLEKQEIDTLKKIASDNNITLYMAILSIFTLLLSKLGGGEDIILGTPTAGRRHADLENIIGMFVNTLAMRNSPHGEKSIRTFLGEVKENTLKAFENQEYQFEDLVDRLSVGRDTGRNPLFDVMFNLVTQKEYKKRNTSNTSNSLNSSDSTDFLPRIVTSKFDLTLSGLETAAGLDFQFEYCTKLFKEETIKRFVIYFKGIVHTISAEPGAKPDHTVRKISEIEILTEKEKKQILYEFNDTATGYPGNKTIHQLFEEQVEKTPEHISTVGNEKTVHTQLTYRQLNKASNRLARAIREKGVGPDQIVGIKVERSLEMVIGLLAILKAGGAYLP